MKKGLTRSQILELDIELTGTCNLSCPLCLRSYDQAQHMVQKNIRPVEEWIAQLDLYTNLEMVYMAGSVSEPTMYKDFIPLIQYLVARGIKMELNTNANTHDAAWWEQVGSIFTEQDRVLFTLCGSTQELHEKYRVNSNLEQILEHAEAFRKNDRKNDWCQLIRFEYNETDLASDAMKEIVSQFAYCHLIESGPYQERFKIIEGPTDIKMRGKLSEKYSIIKDIVSERRENGSSCEILCPSYNRKFLSINQFGEEFPCFLYRLHRKTGFDLSDYSDIDNFAYDFCFECESLTSDMLEKHGMETIV